MGALALTGQPAKADPFRPLPGDVTHVPYGDVGGAAPRRSTDAHRDGDPGADPGRDRRGRPAARLPRRGPGDHRRGTARCWSSTRCRPASAAPGTGSPTRPRASSPTSSPWPRGSAAACRSAPASPSAPAADLLGPGSHGTTFGGNPVCCAAALAVLATIAAEGLLDHVKRVGERLRRGIEALGHPLVAGVRGAGLLLGIVLTAPVAGGARRARCATPASWSTRCSPDVLRLAPPLILTAEQADAFLAALPAALDGGGHDDQALPARRRPEPGRAGRGARPGRAR